MLLNGSAASWVFKIRVFACGSKGGQIIRMGGDGSDFGNGENGNKIQTAAPRTKHKVREKITFGKLIFGRKIGVSQIWGMKERGCGRLHPTAQLPEGGQGYSSSSYSLWRWLQSRRKTQGRTNVTLHVPSNSIRRGCVEVRQGTPLGPQEVWEQACFQAGREGRAGMTPSYPRLRDTLPQWGGSGRTHPSTPLVHKNSP